MPLSTFAFTAGYDTTYGRLRDWPPAPPTALDRGSCYLTPGQPCRSGLYPSNHPNPQGLSGSVHVHLACP